MFLYSVVGLKQYGSVAQLYDIPRDNSRFTFAGTYPSHTLGFIIYDDFTSRSIPPVAIFKFQGISPKFVNLFLACMNELLNLITSRQ